MSRASHVRRSDVDWSSVQDDRHDRLEALSESLWRERHLLGRLVFKFAIVRALLASGAYTWLPMAADEAAELLEEVDCLERDQTTTRALRELAATSPEPWDRIFSEHCQVVVALRRQVRLMTSGTVRDLAEQTDLLPTLLARLEAEDETNGAVLQAVWSGLCRIAMRAGGSWEPDEMN